MSLSFNFRCELCPQDEGMEDGFQNAASPLKRAIFAFEELSVVADLREDLHDFAHSRVMDDVFLWLKRHHGHMGRVYVQDEHGRRV